MQASKLAGLATVKDEPKGAVAGSALYGAGGLRGAWARMRLRLRTRACLAELSAEQLRDVGLSREQAQREARLPFWR
jgi:uncharacterized protein YjiS (DUF1127 family)